MITWIKEKIDHIRGLFNNEYQLTVWFVESEIHDANGNLMCTKRLPKVFYLTSIEKLTQKHIIGNEKDVGRLVIKTEKPFDYNLRKLK